MAHVIKKEVPAKVGKTRIVYASRWKESGKQREKAFPTKREALAFASEMQRAHEDKPLSLVEEKQATSVVFKELANDYLTALTKGYDGGDPLEAQTLRTYRKYLENRIIPYFTERGGTVASATATDLETIRERMQKAELAARSIREVLRLTKAVFAYGVKRGILSAVPGATVTLKPTRAEKTKDKLAKDSGVFNPAQIAALLRAADNLANGGNRQIARAWALYRPLAYLLVHTGMRISEARGFPRSGFDKTAGLIRIRQRAAEDGEIGTTKSADGIRDIPLHPDLIPVMEAALKLHNRDLMFSGADGTPRNYQN
ncbi:MAG: hypothetical protein WCS20_15615, partial [Alphaproteobacteria bacterium]